jgi:hypothetical protein
MANFSAETSNDCMKCDYIERVEGNHEDEDYFYYCNKVKCRINFINNNQKPCHLSSGEYYVATYKIHKDNK